MGGGMGGLFAGIAGGAGRLKDASARAMPENDNGNRSASPRSEQFESELAQRIGKQKVVNESRKSQQELPSAILEFERAASKSKPPPARIFRWGEEAAESSSVSATHGSNALIIEEEEEEESGGKVEFTDVRTRLKPPAATAAVPTASSTRRKPRGGIAKSFRKSVKNLFRGKRASAKQLPAAPASWNRPAISSPVAAVSNNGGGTVLLRKPGSVTVAEIDAGLPADDEFETLDTRAVDAARWTDKVIVQLIGEIKTRGSVDGAGRITVTFGKLFDETADIFDALVGILKTAKKYNVCAFNKDQMWQGADDNEIITLLKDTHDGILINRRKNANLRTAPTGGKTTGFGQTSGATLQKKCHACGKTVYPMEYLGASGKAFHKSCFRCATCNNVLKATSFCTADSASFYCEPHYKEMILSSGGLTGGRDAYSITGGGKTVERRLSGISIQSGKLASGDDRRNSLV